jgi:carbon-monoxide dehydrogenase large subunit
MIGTSPRRLEDPVLLRGEGRFAADMDNPGQVHMRVVRSPVAHGALCSIDTTAARSLVGVVAVWTFADVADVPPIDFRLTGMPEMKAYRQFILARDRVRYVGEPVAVVFAEDAYLAEDAADLVEMDIDPLQTVLEPGSNTVPWLTAEQAAFTAAPEVEAPGAQNTEAARIELEYGTVDESFANAAHIVEVDVRVGRHSGVPLECRGALARVDRETGVLMFDGAAKVPFFNRDSIARMVGFAPHQVQVREGHVGGGFGPRGELYPEDVLVSLGAVRLGRPVKWVEDRRENLVAMNHSRDQRHHIRAAVRDDGFVLAIDDEFWTDQGAYIRTHGATVSSLTASMIAGPYKVPSLRVLGHIRMTNKTPSGTYRSPGRYEGTFARERLMDAIAHKLGLDRVDVRRTNFIAADEMPYERPIQALGTDLVYDSGKYHLLQDKAESAFTLNDLTSELERRRAAGERVGIGYAWFVEKSGFGPYEGAQVSVDTSGSVIVTSVGQGVDTVMAQIVADGLGVSLDKVRAVRGQTDRFGYGRGAFATRQSVVAGSAAFTAAEEVKKKAITVAASHLEIDESDLEVVEGRVQVVGTPGVTLSLGRIAELLEPVNAGRLGLSPGLVADGWFTTEHMTYPYGVHVAVVRVDVETGCPELEKYFVAFDIGRALNPKLVDGQIAGGVAQGIGGALFEQFTYSTEGQPTSTSFMDYLIPTMAEIPEMQFLVTEDAPSPINPLGVKGAGEGGTTAVAAAIASALDDALGMPGAITHTPVRPDELKSMLDFHRNNREGLI